MKYGIKLKNKLLVILMYLIKKILFMGTCNSYVIRIY